MNGNDRFRRLPCLIYFSAASTWANGYIKTFNGKLRDELVAHEQFDTLPESTVLVECWRRSSLGYRAPAPAAIQPASFASTTPRHTKQAGAEIDSALTYELVPHPGAGQRYWWANSIPHY